MHENEIQLVFKTDHGNIIPSREYRPQMDSAVKLGPKHVDALTTQTHRQIASLGGKSIVKPAA
jgi:hypothetical protein